MGTYNSQTGGVSDEISPLSTADYRYGIADRHCIVDVRVTLLGDNAYPLQVSSY